MVTPPAAQQWIIYSDDDPPTTPNLVIPTMTVNRQRTPALIQRKPSYELQQSISDAACEECAHKDPLTAVLIDVTWISGLADPKFTIPTHYPTPPTPRSTSRLSFQRSDDERPTSGGGNLDMRDDMYVDHDTAPVLNNTDFNDTTGIPQHRTLVDD